MSWVLLVAGVFPNRPLCFGAYYFAVGSPSFREMYLGKNGVWSDMESMVGWCVVKAPVISRWAPLVSMWSSVLLVLVISCSVSL